MRRPVENVDRAVDDSAWINGSAATALTAIMLRDGSDWAAQRCRTVYVGEVLGDPEVSRSEPP